MLPWPRTQSFELQTFHDELARSVSSLEQEQALLNAIACFGYDTFLFGVTDSATNSDIKRLYLRTNMSAEWIAEYEDNEYAKHDVLARHCANSDKIFLWSEMRGENAKLRMSQDEFRVAQAAERAGFRVGVTVPLRISWNNHTFGMSFTRRGARDYTGHNEMVRVYGNALSAIARLFLTFFNMAQDFVQKFNISTAEWSVILVSFSYPKVLDQARKLGRSENTIRNQWQSIFGKAELNSQVEIRQLAFAMGATRLHYTK